jgi:hypothetical protein
MPAIFSGLLNVNLLSSAEETFGEIFHKIPQHILPRNTTIIDSES